MAERTELKTPCCFGTEGGVWDQETGEELVPPTALDGWHANYSGELPEALSEYALEPVPSTPYRVFAG